MVDTFSQCRLVLEFPSPCGELVWKALENLAEWQKALLKVSVPLRGIGLERACLAAFTV